MEPKRYKVTVAHGEATEAECWAYENPKSKEVYVRLLVRGERVTTKVRIPR